MYFSTPLTSLSFGVVTYTHDPKRLIYDGLLKKKKWCVSVAFNRVKFCRHKNYFSGTMGFVELF